MKADLMAAHDADDGIKHTRNDQPVDAEFNCEVLNGAQAVHAVVDAWRQLEKAVVQGAPGFQVAGWNLAWMQTFCENGQEHAEPCVLLVRDATGQPLLLWPLMREHYPLRLSVYTWLSDPYGQYGDVLTSLQGEALCKAMQTALQALKRQGGDLVRLRHVRDDAACKPFLDETFRATCETCAAPWLDLSQYATLEELRARFTNKQRRRRRKAARQLQRHVGAEPFLRLMTDRAEMRATMDRILACKKSWLREKGLISRALFNGHARNFLHALVEQLPPAPLADEDTPALALSVMETGERQLSWEVGIRFKRRHYAWLTSHEPDVTRYSVGRLHMYLSQLRAWEDGVQVYDLLVPDAPHKESWSSHKTPVRNYFLPLSLRGRLLGAAYLNHLRPFARDVYNRMPPQLRRALHLSEITDHDAGMQ